MTDNINGLRLGSVVTIGTQGNMCGDALKTDGVADPNLHWTIEGVYQDGGSWGRNLRIATATGIPTKSESTWSFLENKSVMIHAGIPQKIQRVIGWYDITGVIKT